MANKYGKFSVKINGEGLRKEIEKSGFTLREFGKAFFPDMNKNYISNMLSRQSASESAIHILENTGIDMDNVLAVPEDPDNIVRTKTGKILPAPEHDDILAKVEKSTVKYKGFTDPTKDDIPVVTTKSDETDARHMMKECAKSAKEYFALRRYYNLTGNTDFEDYLERYRSTEKENDNLPSFDDINHNKLNESRDILNEVLKKNTDLEISDVPYQKASRDIYKDKVYGGETNGRTSEPIKLDFSLPDAFIQVAGGEERIDELKENSKYKEYWTNFKRLISDIFIEDATATMTIAEIMAIIVESERKEKNK